MCSLFTNANASKLSNQQLITNTHLVSSLKIATKSLEMVDEYTVMGFIDGDNGQVIAVQVMNTTTGEVWVYYFAGYVQYVP